MPARATTYRGRVIRISERTYFRLFSIKQKKNFKNVDSVITRALKTLESRPKKRRKRKKSGFFDSEGYGI